MKVMGCILRGVFLCQWDPSGDDVPFASPSKHSLDFYVKEDQKKEKRLRTTTFKEATFQISLGFSHQQNKLRERLVTVWIDFDKNFGSYKPIFDFIAMHRLDNLKDKSILERQHSDNEEVDLVDKYIILENLS